VRDRGKQFEERFRTDWLKTFPQSVIIRLPDQMSGYKTTSRNICDFICFNDGILYLIECKSHKGNTLPFSCIREEQIKGMSQKALLKGVTAGLIIWYIDHDLTVWVPIDVVLTLINFGHKSINIKDLDKLPHLVICGKKKRVYFDYDMEKFFNDLYGVK
jgi:recombination protein U